MKAMKGKFVRAAHRPAARHSSSFSGSSAGCEDEYGSVMPSASAAHAMVLAVYMPPHAPAPGHALRTMSARWRSSIRFAAQAPGDGQHQAGQTFA